LGASAVWTATVWRQFPGRIPCARHRSRCVIRSRL
jgi:hypothetical protein